MGHHPPSFSSLIGPLRFQTYLDLVEGDEALAVELYDWNIRASGAFWELHTAFEVALRNKLDAQLKVWNERNGFTPEWTINPHPLIEAVVNPSNNPNLNKALRRASGVAAKHFKADRRQEEQPRHDDVLSQLTFGTWKYLIPASDKPSKRKKLWDEQLHMAFPRWSPLKQDAVKHLARRIAYAHELRNRIAHLEPLVQSNLRQTRRGILMLGYLMGRDAHEHCKEVDRTLELLDDYPLNQEFISWRSISH